MEVAGLGAIKDMCATSINSLLTNISKKGNLFCNLVAKYLT